MDEGRESFFVSGLGTSRAAGPAGIRGPILNRDATPTILDFAGIYGSDYGLHGRSWKSEILKAEAISAKQ